MRASHNGRERLEVALKPCNVLVLQVLFVLLVHKAVLKRRDFILQGFYLSVCITISNHFFPDLDLALGPAQIIINRATFPTRTNSLILPPDEAVEKFLDCCLHILKWRFAFVLLL